MKMEKSRRKKSKEENGFISLRLTFCRSKSLIYGTRCPDRRSIDAPVEEEHDEHWNIKTAESAINYVSGIISELTSPRTLHVGRGWLCGGQ